MSANGKDCPLVLACTGGIGSGKTFVAGIFEHLGVPVYYSDTMAKKLYSEDREMVEALVRLLGDDVVEGVLDNGIPRLEFKRFADKIFRDTTLKRRVEAIVHPAVLHNFEKWRNSYCGKRKYVIIESAIILELPIFNSIEKKVLAVMAPKELRIKRVMNRDNISEEMVLSRMRSQWSDRQRAAMADFVIFADEKRPLIEQVLCVDEAMNRIID